MHARLIGLSSLVLAMLLGDSASAAEHVRIATLVVTGQANVTRAPDRAIVSFEIVTTDADSTKATSQNNAIVNALTAKITALGLPASALQTTGYSLSFQPRPSKPDPASDQRYGFTVERSIAVTVDQPERAGAIVDAGVGAGATSVGGVQFVLRDPHAAQRAAQAAAVDDAVQQARGLAGAAGVRLVRILSIAPGGASPRPMPMMRMAMSAQAPVPTQIDPSTLTIDATVTLSYEIDPAKS